ncbi:MAG TPA: ornithine cyclodeaminase family protein [Vicinamibacterales bacterium]|nr:ornithine cyclodeaminase family protein [Vicinamibacterales bacterium]
MLLLTENDVRDLLPMPDLIEAMAGALSAWSAGQVTQPVRTVIEVGHDRAFFGVMPAAFDARQVVGAKLVTVYERNHDRGLPSHLATVVLLDHATGALVALLDGRYITEARTAAVSAVSVRLLARPDAGVLGIIGSGVQARSHLDAVRHVRPLDEVRVWSPTRTRLDAAVDAMRRDTGLDVRAADSPAAAVRGAHIVVLATSSRTAVVESDDIDAGTHVVGVGACRPDQREMPAALVARTRFFVDSRAGALREAGDLLLPIGEGAITEAHIAGELGEVVAGRVAGRTSADEVTVFKSLGMAVEDLVAADLALSRARHLGVGREISLA